MTSIEKLFEDYKLVGMLTTAMVNHYQEMHKQEMDKLSGDWFNEGASYMYDGKRKYETFEQYYQETFKKD